MPYTWSATCYFLRKKYVLNSTKPTGTTAWRQPRSSGAASCRHPGVVKEERFAANRVLSERHCRVTYLPQRDPLFPFMDDDKNVKELDVVDSQALRSEFRDERLVDFDDDPLKSPRAIWLEKRITDGTFVVKERNYLGFKSFQSALLVKTLFACKNHHGKVADILLTNTRATKKLLTPPFAFWTPDEPKNSAHSKVRREDWNGRKRDKLGQLCASTEIRSI